jgi:hypothetical protein
MSKNFKQKARSFLLFCLLICSFSLIISAQKIKNNVPLNDFKNLAGTIEEIPSMRLPNPATLGTRSKAAMFPISSRNNFQEIEIPVDSTENFRLMLLSPNGKSLNLSVALPNDDFFDLRSEGFARQVKQTDTTYGLDGNQFPAEVFSFDSLKTGVLRVQIELPKNLLTTGETIGYLVASSDSPYRLYSYINTLQTTVGREIGIVSSIFNRKENGDDGQPAPIVGNIRESRALIHTPSGETLEFPMADRGNGEFQTNFVPGIAGRYSVQIFSKGSTPDGSEFIRSSEQTFEVAASKAEIETNIKTTAIDDLRWRIDLPVSGLKAGEKTIVHAEIWGRDTDGSEFPVSWFGGMTIAETVGKRAASVSLTLDSRWLAQNSEAKSFVLKNIRLQNPDNSVVLGEAASLSLPNVRATELAKSFAGIITEDMRQGVRPAKYTNDAIGGKLMLVHGYCSGDAWGAAASAGQFTNYVKFLDLNKNRSHDQFANLIKTFGASLPSYGIVAHSQGGAASLHLYTYYWSGLDYATGGARLIQSVGTPYQGTALAGNLALLGQIFGAGCGSNYDMTYSGAAAWIANIPSWARAKVYYHTTSFTDVWYRYDYCNIATDPFLSDPDDGVVEHAYAQLTGANNLGHKTGWCHTSGMRDPSQTTDASRNSNMNSNAAR